MHGMSQNVFRRAMVGGVSEALASAIKAFAERGGGVILAAGRHTEAGEFNRAFAGVAPAQVGETVQSRGYALMSQLKSDHPIFAPFAIQLRRIS